MLKAYLPLKTYINILLHTAYILLMPCQYNIAVIVITAISN